MKQVFPRFCNPVNPKEPASKELPKIVEEWRAELEMLLIALPFIKFEVPLVYGANSSFLTPLFLTESDRP